MQYMYLKMFTCRNCHVPKGVELLYFILLVVALVYFSRAFYFSIRRLEVNDWNDHQSSASFDYFAKQYSSIPSRNLTNSITVVTAYFDLGELVKGREDLRVNLNDYSKWFKNLKYLNNTLIVYTDSQVVVDLFQTIRADLPQTKTRIFKINRDELWSFKISKKIKRIFAQPGYPRFSPNTVNENYSSAMHSKYELINRVIQENLYTDRYIAWLDVGYFRDPINKAFNLEAPPGIDDNKVSFYQYEPLRATESPSSIIQGNYVWVGGGNFIARPEIMQVFIEDYMRGVTKLLESSLMSTDQQVLHIIYAHAYEFHPRVQIQVHTVHDGDWFHLGHASREVFEKRRRLTVPLIQFFHMVL